MPDLKTADEKDATPGKCEDCGKDIVYSETRCDSCEDHYVECGICNEEYQDDSTCCHLRWHDRIGCWGGCGATCGCVTWDNHREDVDRLLDAVALEPYGLQAIREVRQGLAAHRNQWVGWERVLADSEIDEDVIDAGDCWLDSLEPGKTDEADDLTIAWIDEWLAIQREWVL